MSETPPPGYGPAPGHGQQAGYGGQPVMGPATTRLARVDPGPSQTVGVRSVLITLVGAALVVVAFTALNWFPDSQSHVSNIRHTLNAVGSGYNNTAKLYFDWLGWALLVAAALAALVAALPAVGTAFRVIAPLLALGAVVVTFLAIQLFRSGLHLDGIAHNYTDYLKHARIGFYVAVGGFVLIGIGGVIGPSRR